MNSAITQWAAGILASGQLLASETQPASAVPIAPIQAPFEMPRLQRPVFPNKSFMLTDYGAMADGTTKNTDAFRKAITTCNAAGGKHALDETAVLTFAHQLAAGRTVEARPAKTN